MTMPNVMVDGVERPMTAEEYAVYQADLARGPFGSPGPKLPPLQFLALFTQVEETAIAGAALANPLIFLWMTKMAGAAYVDLSDPQTKAGLDSLVGAGLLTAARETAILANQAPA